MICFEFPIVVTLMLDQFDTPIVLKFCVLQFVYVGIFVVAYPYSWQLTSCGTYSNGSRLYYDTYFIPPTSFWELSLPPPRSIGSSFVVFVYDGHAPLVYPFSSFSFEVYDFGVNIRGSYWNNGTTFLLETT